MSIAVVGCGYWGKNLVRNFSQLNALTMVCDSTEAGRLTASSIAPDAVITGTFEDVLDSATLAVAIATPAETHYDLTKAALLAGKDVFVEKPLALTYDHGTELVGLAKQKRKILMVGHVLEYHPGILRLRELIDGNELGRVRYIYSNRLSLGKIRREENILWSFAPHDIAVILRLVNQSPFQVTATGGSYVSANVPDVTVTNLLFDNGVRGHIFVSWLHPFKEQRLVVVGDRKMASFDDVQKQLVLYDQRVEVREGNPVPVLGDGPMALIPYASDEPLRRECEAMLDSMSSRVAPLTDGDSALRVLSVLQAAQRSLVMNGEPVPLPPQAASRVSVFA